MGIGRWGHLEPLRRVPGFLAQRELDPKISDAGQLAVHPPHTTRPRLRALHSAGRGLGLLAVQLRLDAGLVGRDLLRARLRARRRVGRLAAQRLLRQRLALLCSRERVAKRLITGAPSQAISSGRPSGQRTGKWDLPERALTSASMRFCRGIFAALCLLSVRSVTGAVLRAGAASSAICPRVLDDVRRTVRRASNGQVHSRRGCAAIELVLETDTSR